jgi:hypothetical protein
MKAFRIRPLSTTAARCMGGVFLLAALALTVGTPAGAFTAPALKMTSGPYHSLQSISLSVGPNHFFKPYSHVNVLECADPKGKKNNLPTSVRTCDGNTIEGDTILVQKDGSFSAHGYELVALPNVALGESADDEPVCSQKSSCVLYVGENQENFTAPKLFSPPFLIQKARKHH